MEKSSEDFTLVEKLTQLRDAELGGAWPAFMQKALDERGDAAITLKQLAKEALEKIAELEEKAWKYDQLCK